VELILPTVILTYLERAGKQESGPLSRSALFTFWKPSEALRKAPFDDHGPEPGIFLDPKSNARREEIDRNILTSLQYVLDDKAPTIRIHESRALQEPDAVQASLTPHFIPRHPKPVERSLQIADHRRSFLLCQPLQGQREFSYSHVSTLEGYASHGVRHQCWVQSLLALVRGKRALIIRRAFVNALCMDKVGRGNDPRSQV